MRKLQHLQSSIVSIPKSYTPTQLSAQCYNKPTTAVVKHSMQICSTTHSSRLSPRKMHAHNTCSEPLEADHSKPVPNQFAPLLQRQTSVTQRTKLRNVSDDSASTRFHLLQHLKRFGRNRPTRQWTATHSCAPHDDVALPACSFPIR